MNKSIYFSAIIALLLYSCSNEKETEPTNGIFHSVAATKSGITFSNDLHYEKDLNIIEYLYYYNGGGVAVGDLNNDGLEDVYFTANQTSDKIYLNQGGLKFKDITLSSNIKTDNSWSTGVTMEDVNNDGLLDIYVSKIGNYKNLQAHNLLYINNGDLTFTESSKEYGLDFSGFSTQASFFDYDNDGDMDMYLLNHAVHTPRSYGKSEKRNETDSLSGDRLFENKLNDGHAYFVDVTENSGIYSSPLGYGLALTTSDVNQDGFIDIYVGNDFHENDYLYINQGDKTFKESIKEFTNHTSRFTMGSDISDINNDGLFDVFTLDMMPFKSDILLKSGGEDSDKVTQIKKNFGFETQYARNTFQLNNSNTSFSDVALLSETHATDWSWSVLLEDYDNDGLTDIYITNGIYKRPNDLDYVKYLSSVDFGKYSQTQQNELEEQLIEKMPAIKISNVLFKNNGGLQFESNTNFKPTYSNGAAYSDLDNDGDIDIITNNINESATLLENKSNELQTNNFVNISLKGNTELANTTGTKIHLFTNGDHKVKELTSTRGFQSSSSKNIHFGLGNNTIDSLEIHWLDGSVQTEKNIQLNNHLTFSKTSSSDITKIKSKSKSNDFEKFDFVHKENKYLDYEREYLIPEKLSIEGPALVSADFNGDGLLDVFVGGAKYQSPELYLLHKDGSYQKITSQVLKADSINEDVDTAVIDLDNDGDLDIYVVSGGSSKIEGDPQYEDRIYLNDGKANFKKLDALLPRTNGSTISIADFNNDGKADIFLGNRSIPGGYGLAPNNFILTNTGNNNFEMASLVQLGLVTNSIWEDLNNDELLDLIVVGDWMPITVMTNNGDGTFTDQTKQFGLEHTNGMWNTVAVADIDQNGFKDIIAGNAGMNLKLKASKENPIKLYLDDFDENEQLDPIIMYNFFGQNVPFASKDKLISQMPFVKKKFLSYQNFSSVENIEAITGKNENEIMDIKEIHELRSMIYLNNGNTLEGTPLPAKAQMSSIQDFYVEEINGKHQVIFIGNYNGYVTELGNSLANSGGVLSNFENGNFQTIKPIQIPKHISTRKISKLSENKYLVVSNNDQSYIIEPFKNPTN